MLLPGAIALLHPTRPRIVTAPPQSSGVVPEGYVGLPEWFWLDPASAGPVSKRLSVGAVWVQVTARAQHLSISPGTGLPRVDCQGTGMPYTAARASGCVFTYTTSSASQPGAAYQARGTVMWGGTWAGSDGAGGTIAAIPVTAGFSLRIGEAQALNGGGR
jgi:hypothetical protein